MEIITFAHKYNLECIHTHTQKKQTYLTMIGNKTETCILILRSKSVYFRYILAIIVERIIYTLYILETNHHTFFQRIATPAFLSHLLIYIITHFSLKFTGKNVRPYATALAYVCFTTK